MKKRKPKPDAWALRPGDLPAPSLLAAEPRLEGLEDNCVFRMAAFRRHLGGRFGSGFGSAGQILLIIVSLYFCGCFGPILMLYFLRYSGGIRGVKQRFFTYSSVPEPLLVELNRTTYSPTDFATALWAKAVTQRSMNATRAVLIVATALASLSMVATLVLLMAGDLDGSDIWLLIFSMVPLAIFGYVLATRRNAPYHVLPGQAGELRRVKRSLEARGKLGVLAGRFLGVLLSILGLLVLVSIASAALIFLFALGVAAVPDSVRWTSRFWWLLFGLSVPALGIAFGLWRARYVRINAERYLQRMTEDLSYILDWFAHEAAEPSPPGEKL